MVVWAPSCLRTSSARRRSRQSWGTAVGAELIGRHHQLVRRVLGLFGGREHDTPATASSRRWTARSMRSAAPSRSRKPSALWGVDIRAGVTFGELELESGKPSGLAVNTTARVMSVGGPGEVLVPRRFGTCLGGRDLLPGAWNAPAEALRGRDPPVRRDRGRRRRSAIAIDVGRDSSWSTSVVRGHRA